MEILLPEGEIIKAVKLVFLRCRYVRPVWFQPLQVKPVSEPVTIGILILVIVVAIIYFLFHSKLFSK